LLGGGVVGLFSRKKTRVEKVNTKVTVSKIVKFSYLQSLAIDGGIADAKQFAGETEATEESFDAADPTKKNTIERIFGSSAFKTGSLFTAIAAPLRIVGEIARALFGKKVRRSTQVDVKDSGFSLVKTWNQPQFDIIRYAMGIRELTVSQFTYVPVSELVSKPWQSPKEIQKVTLIVDQFIPNQFPPGQNYIEYYIKPDLDEAEWVRINPVGLPTQFTDGGSIVPRIVSFNTEKPVNSSLEDAFVTTEQPVRTIRFRAVLKRPETIVDNPEISANAYSPVLKSYRLLLTPRGGLS
jgi:hypothetical protein